MSRNAAVLACALAVAGCTAPPTEPPVPPPPPPAAAASRPAPCGAQLPEQRDPFPYNRDWRRRDDRLFGDAGMGRYADGGAATFEDLDATGLAALIEDRFVDPHEGFNTSPTSWEVLQFLCRHPGVRIMGQAISPDREDYRLLLTSVYAAEADAALRAESSTFCAGADEVELDSHFECFWD